MGNEKNIIETSIKSLEESLRLKEPNFKDFQEVWKSLQMQRIRMLELTEYAKNLNAGDKNWIRLLNEIAESNIPDLMDKLRRIGYSLRQNPGNNDLIKAFSSAAFRLLEQTRAGKKDDVYYGILRIFVTQKRNVPTALVTAFKYERDTFKVLIFSFLSGILGKEDID